MAVVDVLWWLSEDKQLVEEDKDYHTAPHCPHRPAQTRVDTWDSDTWLPVHTWHGEFRHTCPAYRDVACRRHDALTRAHCQLIHTRSDTAHIHCCRSHCYFHKPVCTRADTWSTCTSGGLHFRRTWRVRGSWDVRTHSLYCRTLKKWNV